MDFMESSRQDREVLLCYLSPITRVCYLSLITSVQESASISTKYDCRVKIAHHKDVVSLVEEGIIMVVKSLR
jgi:hypothetical protein